MDMKERVRGQHAAYAHGEERPLGSYGLLVSTYAAAVGGLSLLVRQRRRPLPERVGAADLALIAVATHKLSRMIAKDSVLSVVRAPFTRYEEPAGAGEVNEGVRGHGVQHAVGELVTCPFCLAQWIATGFVFGLALSPRVTRMVASVFSTVAASDALQFGWTALEQAVE